MSEDMPLIPLHSREIIDKETIPDDLTRAVILFQSGKFNEAHRILLGLVKFDPKNPKVWLLLAWTAPSRPAAITYFRKCFRLDPENQLAKEGLTRSHVAWEYTSMRNTLTDLNQPQLYIEPAHAITHPDPITIELNRKYSTIANRQLSVRQIPFLWIMGFYLFTIALAELVTTFFNPQFGLIMDGILILVIFLHTSLCRVKAQQKFLCTVMLVPLIRLVSLSMPLVGFESSFWFAIIGIPLLLSAYLVFRFTGYKLAEIGISTYKLPVQLLIGLSGIGLGWVEYQILKPDPLVQNVQLQDVLMISFFLLLFSGFLEEFIFRGLMQHAGQDVLGKYSLGYVALMFAVLYIGYHSLIDFVFVYFVGLCFGLIAKHTRSIWGVTLAHGLASITVYIIMPFF